MAKASRPVYVCQTCGTTATRWSGKCAGCGEWNTMTEEADAGPPPGGGVQIGGRRGVVVTLEGLSGASEEAPRIVTCLVELDRVTGGGIVPGSAILIGGEPGIGKSTLLLQLAAHLAGGGRRTFYFSGEEATSQVRLRAERLGLAAAPVALASETNLANILATAADGPTPDLVIVDSVQTLWSDALEAPPGTVSQMRATAQSLIRFAKQTGSAVILVGHVTKDGQIAGPKVIEHMVDTVLYFEGDRGNPFRLLRAIKNRFGATDEIGVFEMAEHGLREVQNPSELFLGDRSGDAPGAAVFAGIEGTRPVLVEIQALVAPSALGTPRRAVVGWDTSRLAMVLAVLDARCGISFANHDVYLAVAGGLKIAEPAADLAATAALLSSFSGHPLPKDHVYFGEVSLSGAVRAASYTANRLREAEKLGFEVAVMPAAGDIEKRVSKMNLSRVKHLKHLADTLSSCD